jgi:hypothetical protein
MNPSHSISGDLRNSDIEYCIDEYVRRKEHRIILKEKWFEGLTFEEIATKHHLSVTVVKDIVYNLGDPILLKASKEKRVEAVDVILQLIRLLKNN